MRRAYQEPAPENQDLDFRYCNSVWINHEPSCGVSCEGIQAQKIAPDDKVVDLCRALLGDQQAGRPKIPLNRKLLTDTEYQLHLNCF